MSVPVGTRVGAIQKSDKEAVYLYGFGVYAGREVPPENRGFRIPNPKIELDNGKVVFGCECYWGPEEGVKKMIDGRRVVEVDINEVRGR